MARRPDGLYDFPEHGLQGVPEQYVPEHLREPAPMDPGPQLQGLPDERMAANAPIVIDSPELQSMVRGQAPNSPESRMATDAAQAQQAEAAAPEAYAAISQQLRKSGHAGTTEVPAAQTTANPANLHGPEQEQPTTTPEQDEANKAYNQYLMHAARGTPGQVIPGGPRPVQETWVTNDIQPRPGVTPVTYQDPVTGRPLMKLVPNAVLYEAEKNKFEQARDEGEAHQQAAMKRQGGIENELGRQGIEAADRERQYVQNLEAQQAKQRQYVQDNDAKIQRILDNLQHQATLQPPEPDLGRRFTLGIAQGLLYAGAAAAGQQVPHVDWISQEIQNDIQKQRLQLEANTKAAELGLHAAGMRINALGQMRQQFTSPEAAEHALAAANWAQYQHAVEAYMHRAKGAEYSDNAQAMWNAADQQRQKEAMAAYAAEHNQVIQNLPAKVVGGTSGGWPGIVAEIKRMHKGEDPKVVQQRINEAWKDFSSGKLFTMQATSEQKMDSRSAHSVNASKVNLDPKFTGGISGVAFTQDDPKLANQINTTQSLAEECLELTDKLDELGAKAGHSIDPTTRRQIVNTAEALRAKMIVMAREGNTDAKIEAMGKRLNLDAYEHVTNMADLRKLTQANRQDIISSAKSLIPTNILSRTPRGEDFANRWDKPNPNTRTIQGGSVSEGDSGDFGGSEGPVLE